MKNNIENTSMNDDETVATSVDTDPCLVKELSLFVNHIDALGTSLPLVGHVVSQARDLAYKEYNDFVATNGELLKTTDKSKSYKLDVEFFYQAERLGRDYKKAEVGCSFLPTTFIVSLISQFDFFLGRLLRCLYFFKPELLNGSERHLTLAQLIDLGSINEAREFLLEKEIECLLRKSHSDQFKWLENKFNLALQKDLKIWPTFIELTERRNLFVHSNGIVSNQYLNVCKEHAVELDSKVGVGSKLGVDPVYFQSAYRCIFEIGVKLAQVHWRKINPDQLETADKSLTEITFNLIVAEQYLLAATLLDFACLVLKKHFSDKSKKLFVLNRAQSYKWMGESERCEEILEEHDWSACGDDLKLAVAVLKDDFKKAVLIMRKLGTNKEIISEECYKEWPIYKEFRKTEIFNEAFEEIFGHPFPKIRETISNK